VSGSPGLRAVVVQALAELGAGSTADRLVSSALPAELRRRLARPDLEVRGLVPGHDGGSAVVDVHGAALGNATVTFVLHGDGSRVTTALCALGGRLPEELRLAATDLKPGPFALADQDGAAAERAVAAVAWIGHATAEIPGDHRWWSEISALLMLGELMNEG
jgi:hypothetical protein